MAEYDELLAALADGEEQEAPPAEQPKDTNAMKQVREALKRAKAAEAELRAERDELAAKFQARVEADTTAALQSAGLSPRQAEAYRKLYDEVTPENIGAFKTEVLQQTSEAEPASLIPLNIGGGEASTKRYTRDEFESIMRSNPMQATQIADAGLVDWDTRTREHKH
jgi:hypothetical protein